MCKRIKVLLLSALTKGAPGGIATWTNMYMNYCSDFGIDCSLVNIAQIGKRMKQGNARINICDEIRRTLLIFSALKKALKYEQFDVAHINTSCGKFGLFRDYLCARKIKKNKIPIVVHFHCDIPFWINNGFSKFALKKMILLSDEIFVLCDSSKKFLMNNYNIDSTKIPNFVEESICIKGPKVIRESLKKIAFVGYVQPEKGINEIIEVSKAFPDITFVLAGQVREDVDISNMGNNILMLGSVCSEGVMKLLDDSDLFLFPTHSEGFSMALIEAMARGLPVITTNVGANADMIEDSGGVIIDVCDVNAIEEAIIRLKRRDIRSDMSAWNVKKVKDSYVISNTLKTIARIYKHLL